MLRSVKLGMTVALLAACGENPASPNGPAADLVPSLAATQVVSTNLSSPINFEQWVECANGGAGESVALTGAMHIVSHSTQSASGNIQVKFQFQPQGLSGIGMLTGQKYVSNGVQQQSFGTRAGVSFTIVNKLRMIGQGSAPDFYLSELLHVTVNANGVTTVDNESLSTDCQ